MSLTLRQPATRDATASAVRRAWLRYLLETRDVPPEEYHEVEERAWHRLASNLAALGTPLGRDGRRRDP